MQLGESDDADSDAEDALISFDDRPSPEHKWQQEILPNWISKRRSPKVRRQVLENRVPEGVVKALWKVALQCSSTDEEAFEASRAAAAALRDNLEWDWDGSLRRSNPQCVR